MSLVSKSHKKSTICVSFFYISRPITYKLTQNEACVRLLFRFILEALRKIVAISHLMLGSVGLKTCMSISDIATCCSVLLVVHCVSFYLSCRITFLPRDARSAKRGIAIVSRSSVRLFGCPSVALRYRGHIGWTSSKLTNNN